LELKKLDSQVKREMVNLIFGEMARKAMLIMNGLNIQVFSSDNNYKIGDKKGLKTLTTRIVYKKGLKTNYKDCI